MDQRVVQQISQLESGLENKAAQRFRQESDRHKAILAKQKEFEEYRDEYERQVRELGRGGISSDFLAGYNNFKSSLDTVIEENQTRIDQSGEVVEQSLDNWSASYRRRKALEQLIDHQSRENKRLEDKKEQKMFDDLSKGAGIY